MAGEKERAVAVQNIHKTFRLPHEQYTSLKNRLLHIKSRKKGYELQHVLKGLSFEIKKGEFFGIVGSNGSGKSTLLKIIAGVYVSDKGHVQVNGSLSPFIELGVGFNPELTGRENVFLNGALLGFSRKQMLAMYDEIVEFAELEKFMDQKLKNYSSGMQVRLAFSIAIRAKGDILLLDEVLAVGDAAFQQKCFNYFEELKHEKRTVILVTHSMDAIKRFCTRAVYLKAGKIKASGDTYEVADAYMIDNFSNRKGDNDKSAKGKAEDEPGNRIRFEISEEDTEYVSIKVFYTCPSKQECYVNLTILKDGAFIGGIITDKAKGLKGTSSVRFHIAKKLLNPGTYSVGGGLFKISNRERIDSTGVKGRKTFLVTGKETRRSGSLKLEDTWEYESSRG